MTRLGLGLGYSVLMWQGEPPPWVVSRAHIVLGTGADSITETFTGWGGGEWGQCGSRGQYPGCNNDSGLQKMLNRRWAENNVYKYSAFGLLSLCLIETLENNEKLRAITKLDTKGGDLGTSSAASKAAFTFCRRKPEKNNKQTKTEPNKQKNPTKLWSESFG